MTQFYIGHDAHKCIFTCNEAWGDYSAFNKTYYLPELQRVFHSESLSISSTLKLGHVSSF